MDKTLSKHCSGFSLGVCLRIMEKSYINLIYLPEKELMSDQKYVHNCMSLIVIIINHPVFKRLALYLDIFYSVSSLVQIIICK